MAKITYNTHDSKTHTVEVQNGLTVMEGAVQNDISGIDADCGGGMACATCHVYVNDEWLDKLPTKEDGEEDMLDMAFEPKQNSRLSCQILVSNELLNIERNTTKKLKQDNTKLIKKIASITEKNRQSFTKLTADYELIIVRMKNLKASLSLEKTKHLKLKNKNKVLEKKITKEKRNTRIVRANYENKILEKQSKLNQLGNKIKAYEKLIEKTTKIQKNIPKK